MSKKAVMVTERESTRIDVSTQDSSAVRQLMKDYWDRWAENITESGTTFELMVGEREYSEALKFYDLDRAEILDLLSAKMKGGDVLELGGGSGRYSGEIAKIAKSIIATDFIESFVIENKETHGKHYSNMSFRTLDATRLDYPPNSFDVIFSNWLLMYLNNEDTAQFAYNNLMMLRPGGYTFFRESHFRPAGSRPHAVNPTVYRTMKQYHKYFSEARYTDSNNDTYFFDLVFAGNSQTYIHIKGNPTQMYYLWQKKKKANCLPSTVSIQNVLDTKVYSHENMAVYDQVIGDGFTAPGGLDCSKDLVSKLNLKPDSLLLDAGSGLGGLVAYLTKECDIDVTGVELSLTAGETAVLRMNNLQVKKGHFHIADITSTSLPAGSFDAVYARETLEYIRNKYELLKRVMGWLKPFGQLLLANYCLGNSTISSDAAALVQSEGLDILSIDNLIKLLEDVGYTDVRCEDYSQQYIEYLKRDLVKLESSQDVSDIARQYFTKLWSSLVTALVNKDIVFAVVIANKP